MLKGSQFLTLFVFVSLLLGCGQKQPVANSKGDEKDVESQEKFVLPPLPKSVEFAGQTIEIDNFDLKERLDKELIVNTFYHSSTIQGFKRANKYFGQLERILKENDIPEDFKYLCLIESGLTQAVSPSGAKGFWQFMPATAKEYGLLVNDQIDERLHIEKSTRAACEYLKDANSQFNDWVLTAASYNRGVNGISNDLEKQKVNSYFDLHLNNETSRYVFRILALKIIFENPEIYGFDPESMELYESVPSKLITVTESIPDLIEWSNVQGTTYHMVKTLNPWIKGSKLTIGSGEFKIRVPK